MTFVDTMDFVETKFTLVNLRNMVTRWQHCNSNGSRNSFTDWLVSIRQPVSGYVAKMYSRETNKIQGRPTLLLHVG